MEKAEKDQKRLQHDLRRARDECGSMVRWAERQAGQRAETEIDLRAELDETRGTLEAVGTEMKAARKEIEMLRRKLNEAEVTAADALSRRSVLIAKEAPAEMVADVMAAETVAVVEAAMSEAMAGATV